MENVNNLVDLKAAKLIDNNSKVKAYATDLHSLIQAQFRLNKINRYTYSHGITLINCLLLQIESNQEELNGLIKETYKNIDLYV